MGTSDKSSQPISGHWLTLFRVWLYLPAPLAFGYLGGQFLTLRPFSIGPVLGGLGCFAVAAFFLWYTRRFERKIGTANVTPKIFLVGFILALVVSAAFPILLHWFYLRRIAEHPGGSEDSHMGIVWMLQFLIPRSLMVQTFPTPKTTDSGSISS